MVEIAGYRCREHVLGSYGTEGKDDCTACIHFIDLLWTYHPNLKNVVRRFTIHVDQYNKNCVFCATYSVMRGVNLKEAGTVDEAPMAPPNHDSLETQG